MENLEALNAFPHSMYDTGVGGDFDITPERTSSTSLEFQDFSADICLIDEDNRIENLGEFLDELRRNLGNLDESGIESLDESVLNLSENENSLHQGHPDNNYSEIPERRPTNASTIPNILADVSLENLNDSLNDFLESLDNSSVMSSTRMNQNLNDVLNDQVPFEERTGNDSVEPEIRADLSAELKSFLDDVEKLFGKPTWFHKI
ncbi:CLUMA_CG010832, isoform A [Clunio marinus]|uniref:CLUMA_CG010832, isoform A n=1 Tax=Clunio marinus TaxID=568069 RepID=A0A1J1IB56_9DIPT|nr:CLUMA_CG010832, isoform A [Clunio marinus]